jgi:hypothetical protein
VLFQIVLVDAERRGGVFPQCVESAFLLFLGDVQEELDDDRPLDQRLDVALEGRQFEVKLRLGLLVLGFAGLAV